MPTRHSRARYACQADGAAACAETAMLQVCMDTILWSAAATNCGMPGILCGPRGIYPPSLEQPFLPPLLTEGPCAAATCRCPAGRGGYDPSAADLCRAVESKPGPAHYAAVVWLHLCSCQTLHVPAPPCQMGGSAVQHLVEASAMGRRCGLQKEPGLVVLAGCNRGCH